MNFRNLGIDEDICDALDSKSITQPFPIQQQAIPLALSGVDMIGQAKTGTGKTFGFGLPMLQHDAPRTRDNKCAADASSSRAARNHPREQYPDIAVNNGIPIALSAKYTVRAC